MISKAFATLLLICAPTLVGGFSATAQQSKDLTKEDPPIPTIDFCDMVAHPARYFDKTIRIHATFEIRTEGATLNSVRCVRTHDNGIGAGSAKIDERQLIMLRQSFTAVRSGRFGHQPFVTIVGILRNKSARGFWSYLYRFDIISFDHIFNETSETIVNFDGDLRDNQTYRAMVRADEHFGLNFASFPLRVPIHQAVRIEWINLAKFPVLQRLRGSDQKQIIFRVIYDDIAQMGPRRWDRNLQLEILLVE